MTSLSDFRAMKDAYFRSGQSPLTPEQRKGFAGLRYYPENAALQFRLPLAVYANPARVTLQTSTGHAEEFERYAIVRFALRGDALSLNVFRAVDHAGLFLPFTDATSGAETYGAGRYLDPEEAPDGTIVLDFNLAYNPYCAYNDVWSCPLPPAENRLPVRIEAGELAFHNE